ncbi:hypothetical protein GDO81_007794 [Engystomops pustulosus]|uniref:Secreted protein n=1 Tax=Engystomops pustulosus TaxID=76066 RepID=A0AAV7CBF2_ENGPU|nr:hypothetical protein GDO81_007794 [Engystomops pustulosus]
MHPSTACVCIILSLLVLPIRHNEFLLRLSTNKSPRRQRACALTHLQFPPHVPYFLPVCPLHISFVAILQPLYLGLLLWDRILNCIS